jgi:hypothetical protein
LSAPARHRINGPRNGSRDSISGQSIHSAERDDDADAISNRFELVTTHEHEKYKKIGLRIESNAFFEFPAKSPDSNFSKNIWR